MLREEMIERMSAEEFYGYVVIEKMRRHDTPSLKSTKPAPRRAETPEEIAALFGALSG